MTNRHATQAYTQQIDIHTKDRDIYICTHTQNPDMHTQTHIHNDIQTHKADSQRHKHRGTIKYNKNPKLSGEI